MGNLSSVFDANAFAIVTDGTDIGAALRRLLAALTGGQTLRLDALQVDTLVDALAFATTQGAATAVGDLSTSRPVIFTAQGITATEIGLPSAAAGLGIVAASAIEGTAASIFDAPAFHTVIGTA